MPPNNDKQFDKLIRSALVASVKVSRPSDEVRGQILRKCEASLLDKRTQHDRVETPRRWFADVSRLSLMLFLRGLGLIGEVLLTERVALLGHRLEGSTGSSMLPSL